MQIYDISHLFKRLINVLEQITICSLDDELENAVSMYYHPEKQNIFSYLGDLRKAVKRLHDLNERIPTEGRIYLPDTFIRSRLVRAARQVPAYKLVIDSLLISPLTEWAAMTSENLYHLLEAVQANVNSITPDLHGGHGNSNSRYSSQQPMRDSLVANSVRSRNHNAEKPNASQKQQKETKTGTCRDFTAGRCKRDPCRFQHTGSAPEQKRDDSKHKNASHPKNKCTKCGSEQHTPKDCKFAGVCGWCKRVGHSDLVCHAKKANRPRAFHADGNGDDGGEVYANMTRVPPIPARALYKKDPAPTMATQSANSDQRAQKLCSFTLPSQVPTL